MTVLRVGRIDYINADPFFAASSAPADVEVRRALPTRLNSWLEAGSLDLSWVSSIEALRHPDEWVITAPHCIAAPGPVRSVVLASPCPLEQLDGATIRVTPASATSVCLLQVLLAAAGVEARLEPFSGPPPAAGPILLIGDEALEAEFGPGRPYVLDLAERWHQQMGVPMVFATLACRREVLESPPHRARVDEVLAWMGQNLEAFRRDRAQGRAPLPEDAGLDREAYERYFAGFEYRWTDATEQGLRRFGLEAARLGLAPPNAGDFAVHHPVLPPPAAEAPRSRPPSA